MIDAKMARQRTEKARVELANKKIETDRQKHITDKLRAAYLGGCLIDILQDKIEEAIAKGVNMAYDSSYVEDNRLVMSDAFYNYIKPHFKALGYELDWVYNDHHELYEVSDTFGVTVTW